jgi:hypothetical protein
MATKPVVFQVASEIDLYFSIACGTAQHTPIAKPSANLSQRAKLF